MPVERTKSWKQQDLACNQLVWTAPSVVAAEAYEPSSAYISEEATIDFDNDGPPPLVDASRALGEFILFPPPTDVKPAPRRAPHSKKKPENHIPRPPNAFILFRSSFIKSQHVSTDVETNHSTLSKIIGLTWKNMSEAERQVWHAKAKIEQEDHRRRFPKYAFKPQQTKGKGSAAEKRKVREVEPKDLKRCQKIAELLVQGKKGTELKSEIEEFDKHHVPQIITRFEAPITARTFRRSSSAPIEQTEAEKESQAFFPTSPEPVTRTRKVRAASARPTRCPTPVAEVPQQPIEAQIPQQPIDVSREHSPSFEFSPFSFETSAAPSPSVSYDPLAEQLARCNTFSPSPELSIDTSSFINDWSQCSSPTTPNSADYLPTPSSSPSYAAPVDPFSQAFEKRFGTDFAPSFPQILEQESFSSDTLFSGLGAAGDFSTLLESPVSLDMDFSSFMTGLPQYAF